MGKGASNFREADVTRAIRAAKAGGLVVERFEIDTKAHKIVVVTRDGEEHRFSKPEDIQSLVERKSKR